MYNYNPIFNQLGRIDSEDSLYWFVAPTNKIWKENIDLYRSYFEYHQSLEKDGDSLQNLYSKFMFLYSSFFNVRSQELPFNEANPDSIVATNLYFFLSGLLQLRMADAGWRFAVWPDTSGVQ